MSDNVDIEIHDSTLEGITDSSETLVAEISAYVHRSPGRPGIDAGTGWSQTLHLRFLRGRASGDEDTVPLKLLAGHLEVSGERFENMIPMPVNRSGPARLELQGWNGMRIVIEGDSVEAALIGDARYIEDFPGGGHTP